MNEQKTELIVCSGSIIAQRLFDVAYAIDLEKAEALWSLRSPTSSSRRRLSAAPVKAISFGVPPVVLTLDAVQVPSQQGFETATVTARLYDFGVICISVRTAVTDCEWTEYSRKLEGIDQAIGYSSSTDLWANILDPLVKWLTPALLKPSQSKLQEDYLLAVVHQWNEPITATDLLNRIDLVPLLSGYKRALSEGTRRDLMRHKFSYYEDDLVVLTWDRALIYEPRGDSDVADILEVANAQLLEMRYYDELLDDELPRMYDLVEETRRAAYLAAPGRFASLARRLYTLVAEVTELTEKVDNALQVTEDVYLARIYTSAIELFRVPNVSSAVDRKLSIVRDTYTALYDESSATRAQLLEITIVVLIAVEIVLALIRY